MKKLDWTTVAYSAREVNEHAIVAYYADGSTAEYHAQRAEQELVTLASRIGWSFFPGDFWDEAERRDINGADLLAEMRYVRNADAAEEIDPDHIARLAREYAEMRIGEFETACQMTREHERAEVE